VRIIAATNQPLEQMVADGQFREDLFYRLNGFMIHLPALRERVDDVPLLLEYYLLKLAKELNKEVTGFSEDAMKLLTEYPWPGNVRELQNEIAKAALLLNPGEPLDLPQLSDRVRRPPGARPAAPPPLTLEETVLRAEREAFAVALAAAQGDAAQAIELLGISRTTYYRKLKELGIGE